MHIPAIIGHRGARASAPENTLAGIREAARQGARWVELDVKLTRDGVPILMHDETLLATAGIDRKVAETGFDELAGLDTLPSFRARYPDGGRAFVARHGAVPVPIPTLEDALRLVLELGLGVDLEIKPCPGRARETASIALAIAQTIWPGVRPPPLVSSFAPESLAIARRIAPGWPRGLLLDRVPAGWRDQADRLDVAILGVNADRLTRARVAELGAARRAVLAWTVNAPARARLLLRWGVSAVFTDRPGLLAGSLRASP